jgi:YD repeat-containing protein
MMLKKTLRRPLIKWIKRYCDAANRLAKTIKDGQNYSFSYDNANRMTGMTMPNRVASQYGFDAASRRLSQILH